MHLMWQYHSRLDNSFRIIDVRVDIFGNTSEGICVRIIKSIVFQKAFMTFSTYRFFLSFSFSFCRCVSVFSTLDGKSSSSTLSCGLLRQQYNSFRFDFFLNTFPIHLQPNDDNTMDFAEGNSDKKSCCKPKNVRRKLRKKKKKENDETNHINNMSKENGKVNAKNVPRFLTVIGICVTKSSSTMK